MGWFRLGCSESLQTTRVALRNCEDDSLEEVDEAGSRFDPCPLEDAARRHRRDPIFGSPDCRPLIIPGFGPGRPTRGWGLAEDQFQHSYSGAEPGIIRRHCLSMVHRCAARHVWKSLKIASLPPSFSAANSYSSRCFVRD